MCQVEGRRVGSDRSRTRPTRLVQALAKAGVAKMVVVVTADATANNCCLTPAAHQPLGPGSPGITVTQLAAV